MKQIVSINFGAGSNDYEIKTAFLGKMFHIRCFGTDGNFEKAAELVSHWDNKADVIGLGNIKFAYTIGPERLRKKHAEEIQKLTSLVTTPIATGDKLRQIGHKWSVRNIQYTFCNNYFNNARILFLSGMVSYTMAGELSEYTDNLTFADPVFENGIPKFLNSLKDLKMYAEGIHDLLKWVPGKALASSAMPLRVWNDHILRKAMQKAHIIVIPYYDFYKYTEKYTLEELGRKTVFTSTAYDDRVQFLKERGVDVIVTATSAAGKKILDIMAVKPGCVITDVARPLDLSAEDVAKRPDVLVIESGEIELPGNPEMKDMGLPPRVTFACVAETIVLALEGRFENFTIGRDIQWEKVREIYKLGLKHGMKLAAISGVNGVFSDEDIVRVKQLALKGRKKTLKGVTLQSFIFAK